MAQDVFVSYSTRDKVVADTVVAALESNQIRCWYAPRDIKPGADWAEEITIAIESSKVMLLIFSENSNHSQRVLDEVNFAISAGLTILPFRIEDLEPRGAMMLHLSTRHWLDAYDPSWEEFLEQLIKTVAANLEVSISDEEIKSSVKKRGAKKKRNFIPAIMIGIILLAAIGFGIISWAQGNLGLGIFAANESIASSEPTSAASTPTPPEQISTISAPPLGSVENPIIWMFVPSPAGEFTEINNSMKVVAANFKDFSGGLELKPIPAPDQRSIIDALCQGEAHIGTFSTFAYLAASEQGCAQSKLIWNAFENITYTGIMFVRGDSGFSDISDLAGKKLCIVSYDSMSSWLLPSLEMRANGIDPEDHFGEIIELMEHPPIWV